MIYKMNLFTDQTAKLIKIMLIILYIGGSCKSIDVAVNRHTDPLKIKKIAIFNEKIFTIAMVIRYQIY
jgi:hypothetical protein